MPVTFSSYRLGPGQRASYKTVPPPWDWLLRRENELGPRRSKSQIIFAVLVPPLYVAVQAPALIVTSFLSFHLAIISHFSPHLRFCCISGMIKLQFRPGVIFFLKTPSKTSSIDSVNVSLFLTNTSDGTIGFIRVNEPFGAIC